MIAPNVILPFDGLNSAIPAGYTRETLLDNKYIKGTAGGVNPNTTGGSATHSHTSPAHSHTLNDHTHTFITDQPQSPAEGYKSAGSGALIHGPHYHDGTTGSISGGTTNETAITYGAVLNDPYYYTVIFIKSSGYNFIPNNAMVFSASTSRSGLSFHTASANRFFKGAGAGANAGDTGGSTQNVHSISHSHSTNSHTHSNTNTGIGHLTAGSLTECSPGGDFSRIDHYHLASYGNTAQAINTYSGSLTTSEVVEPAYRTLNAFKNTSGASQMPKKGDIALWLGSLSSIPVGWKLCDGSDGTPDMRDRYYKNPASASASSIGGNNTHSHTAQSHSHTSNGTHYHSVSTGYDLYNHERRVGNANVDWNLKYTHVHSCNTSSITASYASANTSANSSSNEPEYRTVAFIQFEFSIGGGAIVTKMLN